MKNGIRHRYFIYWILILSITFGMPIYSGNYLENFNIEYDNQTYQYESKEVTVVINGHTVKAEDMPAIVIDPGHTLVPLREIFESPAFGAKVMWNAGEITVSYSGTEIIMQVGSDVAMVNGVVKKMPIHARLIREVGKSNAKTMIPLRFISESLGLHVDWNGDTFTAYVDVPAQQGTDHTIPDAGSTEDRLDGIDSGYTAVGLPTALFNNPKSLEAQTANSGDQDGIPQTVGIEMVAENHDVVSITDIKYHPTVEGGYFELTSTGSISSYNRYVWEGKLIIDIVNAHYGYNQGGSYTKEFKGNPFATTVRSSEQKRDSDNRPILRVVFDLTQGAIEEEIRISDDRTSLYIGPKGQMSQVLLENTLDKITVHQNAQGDYVDFQYGIEPEFRVFRLSSPDRLVIDLLDQVSLLGTNSMTQVGGQYIRQLRTAQFGVDDPNDEKQNQYITRVVLETEGHADYELVQLNASSTRLLLKTPTYENISYENKETPTIILEDVNGAIDVDGILYEDLYRDNKFIITLPGNYESNFGSGVFNIHDGIIESVDIYADDQGRTKIEIKQKDLHIYQIEKRGKDLLIKAYKPKELFDKIIVIDPGHGGTDPGAVVTGYTEKALNIEISLLLKKLLDGNGTIKVYYTRLDDRFVSLADRMALANQVEADFFVSIHNNAHAASTKGTETLYFKGDVIPGLTSFKLANIVHNQVIKAVTPYGQTDRKVQARNLLYVLKNAHMPTILLEGGFMTNSEDMGRLAKSDYQQVLAEAIYKGVLEVFEQYPTNRRKITSWPIVVEPVSKP